MQGEVLFTIQEEFITIQEEVPITILEVILICGASPVGVGCVLAHRVNQEDYPVAYAYASSILSKAQKNYSQIDSHWKSFLE